eukprot:989258-Rhodomonas_salina.1
MHRNETLFTRLALLMASTDLDAAAAAHSTSSSLRTTRSEPQSAPPRVLMMVNCARCTALSALRSALSSSKPAHFRFAFGADVNSAACAAARGGRAGFQGARIPRDRGGVEGRFRGSGEGCFDCGRCDWLHTRRGVLLSP